MRIHDKSPARHGFFSSQRLRILLLLAVGAAVSVAAIRWYYLRQREATENAFTDELIAITDAKTKQIANWRRERIGDGNVLASSPVLKTAERVLANKKATDAEGAEIMRVLAALSSAFSYSSGTLVDLDGNVLIELNSNHPGSLRLSGFARQAARSGAVQLSDIYRDPRSGRALLALTIPVAHAGALILDIEASRFLYPYLESWPTASRTAETYLLRREGNEILYLSNVRHIHETALVFRRPLSISALPDENVLMKGWLRKANDYRGVPALIMVRRIPDSPWYLNAKIDVSEIEAPLRRLWWEMAFIFVLVSLASGGVVGLAWRSQQLEERIRTSTEIQELNARLIGAQEEERARIARELHDDVCQQIAAASIEMSNLKHAISTQDVPARAQTDRIQQKLADLAEGVRRLSHELHPAVLEHSGLASALREYCNEFSEVTGIRLAVETEGAFEALPRTTALSLYRIAQEALRNVAKHAKVKDASVRLSNSRGLVSLTIEDRGSGMLPARTPVNRGLGLLSIKERTRLINGTLEIQSQPNRGTTISVRIPSDEIKET